MDLPHLSSSIVLTSCMGSSTDSVPPLWLRTLFSHVACSSRICRSGGMPLFGLVSGMTEALLDLEVAEEFQNLVLFLHHMVPVPAVNFHGHPRLSLRGDLNAVTFGCLR
jgi:hypothetical protein